MDAAVRAEFQKLAEQLEVSQRKLAELEKQKPNVTVNSFRDRKVSKFNRNVDVDEWIQNVLTYVNSKTDSEQEKVSFIFDHLDEDAKIEIRLHIDQSKATSKELLDVLKDAYGIKDTQFELQQKFFARNQLESESLTDYSHVLMKQLFDLQKLSPDTFRDSQSILKQRFGEGVRDLSLRRELKRLNRERNDLKFVDVRDQALSWVQDSEVGATADSGKFDLLLQTVQQQQQQIEQLTLAVREQSQKVVEVAENRNYRYKDNRKTTKQHGHNQAQSPKQDDDATAKTDTDAEIICNYCAGPNHIAPQCWKRRRDRRREISNR